VRRFDLEHTIRFYKQALGWATPRPRHPEQADRWTWLVLAGYTQLRLARCVVGDRRLPWEQPRPPGRLTPGRVRRGFPQLLARLGSPADAPKPCGRSRADPAAATAARPPAIRPQEGRLTTTTSSTTAASKADGQPHTPGQVESQA
jgi:hypothetical protein